MVLVAPGSQLGVCRVAVIPFVNETHDLGVGLLASRIFSNELVNAHLFTVVSEGGVRHFAAQKKLFMSDLRETQTALYRELGDNLQVDAVIRGTVMKSGIADTGQDGSVPFVGLKIEIVDVRSGKLLVDSFHQRRGDEYRKIMHVGIIRTKTGLLDRVVEEVIQQWKKNGVVKCQSQN